MFLLMTSSVVCNSASFLAKIVCFEYELRRCKFAGLHCDALAQFSVPQARENSHIL